MPSQSSLTSRYYKRTITDTGGADITGDAVSFAFTVHTYPDPPTKPTAPDIHLATYVAANTWRLLVGTGGVVLAVGTYDVWQKLADTPETDFELVDVLEIY